jgi:hypothetical protein
MQWDELRNWWQNQSPETQTLIWDVGLVLAALLGGHLLGSVVARALRRRNFDGVLRLPLSSPASPEADRGFTPTWVAGMLVRLTVWTGAGWWLAREHGQAELAGTLALIVYRTWALVVVLTAALALGSLLARRLIDCFGGLGMSGSDASSRNGAAVSSRGAAGVVGVVAYVLTGLLVLLIAADAFDWPLTRTSALALWQLAQHLLMAGLVLFIGCLGARWARDAVTLDGAASPEKRAGQYTGLGIVAFTTVIAVALLLSSAGVMMGLAGLVLLGLLLWLVRGHVRDVIAGFQLRAHKVREVWMDGMSWHVAEVGLVTSQVGRGGEFCRMQNRAVLEARMHGAANGAAVR